MPWRKNSWKTNPIARGAVAKTTVSVVWSRGILSLWGTIRKGATKSTTMEFALTVPRNWASCELQCKWSRINSDQYVRQECLWWQSFHSISLFHKVRNAFVRKISYTSNKLLFRLFPDIMHDLSHVSKSSLNNRGVPHPQCHLVSLLIQQTLQLH